MGRLTGSPAEPVYQPRALQADLHRRLKRFNVLVAHRRFGKTVFALNEILAKAAVNARPAPRYAYVAPTYRQAKIVAWDYLKLFTRAFPGVTYHETELRCDLASGVRITLYGADRADSLRGIYLDGVVLDEYAQMSPRVWNEVIRPALSDRHGWAVFIGTPMGRNSFWDLHSKAQRDERWFATTFRASETGVVDEEELQAARKEMPEESYAQEFECSFDAPLTGAYYAKLIAAAESEGRIANVPWEPGVPVHTAWDLGVGDSTAIWFCQQVDREVRLIDYHESSGVGLDHYVRALQDRPYAYGDHLLPKDVDVRELGTGKTRLEVLAALGVRARIVPGLLVDDGIQAARNLLPGCWFDATKCSRGLDALRQYRRDYAEQLKMLRARPRHDWASHAADAFRYLAVGLRRNADESQAPIEYQDGWIV